VTILELVWTITPALILMAIAFPSFRLLYLMDNLDLYLNLVITATLPIKDLQRKSGTTPISKIFSKSTAIIPFRPVRDGGVNLNFASGCGYAAAGSASASLNIRLNKYSRDTTMFNHEIISQIVGHLLGDGSLHYSRTSTTPYFIFTQTIKRFEYIWHVYLALSPYCYRLPIFNQGLRKGIPYPFLQVMTRSYPALIPLHELFYKVRVNGNGYIKVINIDLLLYLNPISLAYWAMDDGSWLSNGFRFHTEGFTFNECYKLAAMLHYRFGLICTIQKKEGKPVIMITSKSMSLFRSIVTPHFHPIMLYKLKTK
jgi:hypothetical protein